MKNEATKHRSEYASKFKLDDLVKNSSNGYLKKKKNYVRKIMIGIENISIRMEFC